MLPYIQYNADAYIHTVQCRCIHTYNTMQMHTYIQYNADAYIHTYIHTIQYNADAYMAHIHMMYTHTHTNL